MGIYVYGFMLQMPDFVTGCHCVCECVSVCAAYQSLHSALFGALNFSWRSRREKKQMKKLAAATSAPFSRFAVNEVEN